MNYIHQNPMKAGLVKRMEDWEYSSFNDYCGNRSETMCNKELASQLLDLNFDTFYDDSYRLISDLDVENLF